MSVNPMVTRARDLCDWYARTHRVWPGADSFTGELARLQIARRLRREFPVATPVQIETTLAVVADA